MSKIKLAWLDVSVMIEMISLKTEVLKYVASLPMGENFWESLHIISMKVRELSCTLCDYRQTE